MLAAIATVFAGLAMPATADEPFSPYYRCVEGKPPYAVFVESEEDKAAIANLKQDYFPNSAVGCLGFPDLWDDVPDPRMAEALWRIGDGTWRTEDINYIKTDPEIAAQVPDPSQPIELGADQGEDEVPPEGAAGKSSTPGVAAATSANCGGWVRAWFKRKSTLGFTTYKYFNKIYYCTTGWKVTRWVNRFDYWENPDVVAYWREKTLDQQGGIGTEQAWSRIERHVESLYREVRLLRYLLPLDRDPAEG
ncbi:hypothetical protein [Nocardioides convexus]|uniref:hypothetical protein n=1 Tax=Nocardioides convexus TaxID=2712224 RepID=UPI002418901D|nr:hypothetical protein [Nocardioides convexus]